MYINGWGKEAGERGTERERVTNSVRETKIKRESDGVTK